MMARLAALAILVGISAGGGQAQAQVPAAAQAAAPSGSVTVQPLWRLPASPSALRVIGESGNLGWPIYVPSASRAAIKSFQLAFQASIAVMPEASAITLTINGQMIARVPIASPNGVKTMVVEIPPGLIAAGWNAVRLEVSQRHRVDCSMASTYELWTQIDPDRTGFVGGAPPMAALSDLPALPTDADGATRLHLLLPKDASPTDLGRAVQALETITIRGHFPHPIVDTVAAPTGLNIAVGNPAFLATLPVSAKVAQPGQISTAADGGVWLRVSGSSDSDMDRAVDALGAPAAEQPGTEDGLRALAQRTGLRLRPEHSLSLAELGIPSRAFSGRVFRESFDVLLPPDAFPADYAEARLYLDGGYAAGLTRDARLLVRVNGIIDGSLDLDRSGGAVFQGQIIHMPLDPFRPGHNRVEIEAQLPSSVDDTCDTLSSIGAKERFLLLGTSTLSLPPLARVAQFPSISATLTGNLRVTPDKPPQLFVPRVTDGAVAAIGTLLINAAASTGVPTGAVFQRGTPPSQSQGAIVVAESADIPAALMSAVGLDPQAVSTAWRSGVRPGSAPPPLEGGQIGGVTDSARLDAWGQRVDERKGWFGGSGSVLGSVGDRLAQSMRAAGLLGYMERPIIITGDTSFVFAQGLIEGVPLTIVTAPDGAALAAGAATMTNPSQLANLAGRAIALEANDTGASLTPARDTAYFRSQAFSFTNDRLIAAGWVSKHAAWYIGAVLIGAVLLGTATWAGLTFGRRADPT